MDFSVLKQEIELANKTCLHLNTQFKKEKNNEILLKGFSYLLNNNAFFQKLYFSLIKLIISEKRTVTYAEFGKKILDDIFFDAISYNSKYEDLHDIVDTIYNKLFLLKGKHFGVVFSNILETISLYEYICGRPLMSSIVVRKDTKKPGGDFENLVKTLDIYPFSVKSEQISVIREWSPYKGNIFYKTANLNFAIYETIDFLLGKKNIFLENSGDYKNFYRLDIFLKLLLKEEYIEEYIDLKYLSFFDLKNKNMNIKAISKILETKTISINVFKNFDLKNVSILKHLEKIENSIKIKKFFINFFLISKKNKKLLENKELKKVLNQKDSYFLSIK